MILTYMCVHVYVHACVCVCVSVADIRAHVKAQLTL